jgi:HEAT repeat protein
MTSPSEIPFQQLLEALLNEDVPFHPRYLYRLSDLDSADLDSLETAWPKVSVWRRQALLVDLEELGERDFVLSFEAVARMALRDSDPQVRQTALRVLWEFEGQDLIPIFIRMMQTDDDNEVRAAAAVALGKFVYLGELDKLPARARATVEESLLGVTQGEEAVLVRRRALEALGYSGRAEVPGLIEQAYRSGKRDWLLSSLVAMGRSANSRWEHKVLPMLENTSPAVRSEAARAAGELELSAARETLIELLEDEDEEVRAATIWSLSQIGGRGVREALEAIQEETEDEEEADFLESALDNLAFTEDLGLFSILDLDDEEDDEDEELEEELDLVEDDEDAEG